MPVPKAVRRASRGPGKSETATEPSRARGLATFILEVRSANLKENKQGPYRSLTGVTADGKLYWAPLDASHKPEKGQMITLKGENKGSFGGEDGKPVYHKITGPNYFPEVVSITDKNPEPSVAPDSERPPLKFGGEGVEGLRVTMEIYVKQHGIGTVLAVLSEIA